MKISTLLFICIFYCTIRNVDAQASWQKRAYFGGAPRLEAVGFGLGDRGYIGTGKNDNNTFKDFWEYDPDQNTWTQKADFAGGKRYSAIGFGLGDKGYVGTGKDDQGNVSKDLWEYDPVLNTWTQKGDVPGEARYEAMGFTIGNKGYVGLGSGSADFYQYNPQTDTWIQKANFPINLSQAVAFAINDKGYAGSGDDTKVFYQYDPDLDVWTKKKDIGPWHRGAPVGFSVNGKGYVGTGHAGNQYGVRKDFWEYDPAANNWTQVTSMPGRRYGAVAFVINDKAFVGTGTRHYGFRNDLWLFIPDEQLQSNPSLKDGENQILFSSLNIFPNPATDLIQLHLPTNHSTMLTLFNLLGEKVKEQTITGSDITIDVSELPAGMYVVRAGEWSGKFVKE